MHEVASVINCTVTASSRKHKQHTNYCYHNILHTTELNLCTIPRAHKGVFPVLT